MAWFWSKPLPPGTPAPDFTALDDRGQQVNLAALRGSNVVLIFYPGDDTAVCRVQLAEFRDRAQQTQQSNTLVFGVNPGNAQSHAAFRRKIRLPFPLLIDAGRAIARAYQCQGLIIRRTVYLIGPDGVIRYAKRGKPGADDVLAQAG